MSATVSYNDAVRRHFSNPRHAGDLAGPFEQILAADVSESADGARVQISAGLQNGRIEGASFRARGCPHLIAAADLACEWMSGQAVENLEKPDLAHITGELSIPAEKAGRILLIEDALATLWAQARDAES